MDENIFDTLASMLSREDALSRIESGLSSRDEYGFMMHKYPRRKPSYGCVFREVIELKQKWFSGYSGLSDPKFAGIHFRYAMTQLTEMLETYKSNRAELMKGLLILTKWRFDELSDSSILKLARMHADSKTILHPGAYSQLLRLTDYIQLNILKGINPDSYFVRGEKNYRDSSIFRIVLLSQDASAMDLETQILASVCDGVNDLQPGTFRSMELFYTKKAGILDYRKKEVTFH